jgi:hypothetical protein
MKRLSVNETWEQCLAMWKWISRRCGDSETYLKVIRLKEEWLKKYKQDSGRDKCYFCMYDQTHRTGGFDNHSEHCHLCPGKAVDKGFHCESEEYLYSSKPRLFYAELKRLNKIRLAKK